MYILSVAESSHSPPYRMMSLSFCTAGTKTLFDEHCALLHSSAASRKLVYNCTQSGYRPTCDGDSGVKEAKTLADGDGASLSIRGSLALLSSRVNFARSTSRSSSPP